MQLKSISLKNWKNFTELNCELKNRLFVVGRLQHDRIIPMNQGNQLKVRYEWEKR